MSEPQHVIPNEWLGLYYDGELGITRREQVEVHLLSCVDCQGELAALKALSRALAVDRLSTPEITVRFTWAELESRLPERAKPGISLLQWLPGIGLLIVNVMVQFIAVASVVVMFMAGQLGGIARSVAWLDLALSEWLLGGITWLLPAQWSNWGLSLFLVVVSAWLAVLYLLWLSSMWLKRGSLASQSMGTLG